MFPNFNGMEYEEKIMGVGLMVGGAREVRRLVYRCSWKEVYSFAVIVSPQPAGVGDRPLDLGL